MWSKIVAQGSHVTYGKEISVIPNCIDSEVFKPVPEITAKLLFNLPVNKNIILINITNDLRKGVIFTRKVIERMLSTCDDVAFVGFGTDTLTGSVFEGLPIKLVGRINDKYSMVMLYNASSVLLSPTMEEPFGQTFIESMSVGTPCVAFNHSGPKDIISHKLDGYLAKFGDVDDLVDGLNYCISEKKALAYNCRKKIIDEFSYLSVSNKIKHFYNLVCGNNDY
jgi:glycosyltransferase involved in cell wall biosynthesis